MRKAGTVLVSALLLSTVLPVMAEDWVAARLQGNVEHFTNGAWSPLARGDGVQNASKIRTAGGGRVELRRGEETIALGGNTEIVINQSETQSMTRIVQVWGTVGVEAEKLNVQHFSVQTPVLAAIVKGTQFTVTHLNGLTQVDVDEGIVEVLEFATSTTVDVRPGQSAAASQMRPVKVTGVGAEEVVYLVDGKAVAAAAREAALERQTNRELPENARASGIDNRANAIPAAQENRSERSAGENNRSDSAADGAANGTQNNGSDNRSSGGQGGTGHGRP